MYSPLFTSFFPVTEYRSRTKVFSGDLFRPFEYKRKYLVGRFKGGLVWPWESKWMSHLSRLRFTQGVIDSKCSSYPFRWCKNIIMSSFTDFYERSQSFFDKLETLCLVFVLIQNRFKGHWIKGSKLSDSLINRINGNPFVFKLFEHKNQVIRLKSVTQVLFY